MLTDFAMRAFVVVATRSFAGYGIVPAGSMGAQDDRRFVTGVGISRRYEYGLDIRP